MMELEIKILASPRIKYLSNQVDVVLYITKARETNDEIGKGVL